LEGQVEEEEVTEGADEKDQEKTRRIEVKQGW
jgi:hypothetical protein